MASTLAPMKPRSANTCAADSISAARVAACCSARVRRRERGAAADGVTYGTVSGYTDVYARAGGTAGAGRDHRAHGGWQRGALDRRSSALDVDHLPASVGHPGDDGAVRAG